MRELLESIEQTPIREEFYLAGGTGLAVQILHRPSFDFDLFSKENHLSYPQRRKILEILKPSERMEIQTAEEGTLRVICKKICIAFFYYPYPLVKPTLTYKNLKIASLADIGLMKLSAIVGRGSKKDFIDLYFLLKDHFSLETLLKSSKRKFPDVRDFNAQVLRSLTYFEDAEPEPTPRLWKKVSWREVKHFLIHEATKIAERRLGIE